MFSDIYKIREVANGLCLEVEGKVSDPPAPGEGGGGGTTTRGDGLGDRLLRGGRIWGLASLLEVREGQIHHGLVLVARAGLAAVRCERARGSQARVEHRRCNEASVGHRERSLA